MPPRLFVGFWTVARRRCGVRVRATRPVRAADAACDSPGLQREATHAGWQTVEAGLNTTPGHPRTCSVNRVRSRMDSVHRMPTQIGSSRLGHPPRAHSRFRRGVKCLCGRAAWWGAAVRNCPTDGRCDAAGAWRRMRTKVLCRHSHVGTSRTSDICTLPTWEASLQGIKGQLGWLWHLAVALSGHEDTAQAGFSLSRTTTCYGSISRGAAQQGWAGRALGRLVYKGAGGERVLGVISNSGGRVARSSLATPPR